MNRTWILLAVCALAFFQIEVLTEEQIAKVESLKGETFEFPTRRSGGGGRPKR